jgi:hypothetical protein
VLRDDNLHPKGEVRQGIFARFCYKSAKIDYFHEKVIKTGYFAIKCILGPFLGLFLAISFRNKVAKYRVFEWIWVGFGEYPGYRDRQSKGRKDTKVQKRNMLIFCKNGATICVHKKCPKMDQKKRRKKQGFSRKSENAKNILPVYSGFWKIVDFGLSQKCDFGVFWMHENGPHLGVENARKRAAQEEKKKTK